MGKRGPAAAPTALKLVRGDRKSRVAQNEPKPRTANRVPAAPAWLSPDAKKVWRELAPEMHAKKVLTGWDRTAFAVFCTEVVHYERAAAEVDDGELLVDGVKSDRIRNPALQIKRDTAQTLLAFAREFGLTPSSRSGIHIPETADADEARRLLS